MISLNDKLSLKNQRVIRLAPVDHFNRSAAVESSDGFALELAGPWAVVRNLCLTIPTLNASTIPSFAPERLRERAAQRRQFGYRLLNVLLRREGIIANHKLAYRVYANSS